MFFLTKAYELQFVHPPSSIKSAFAPAIFAIISLPNETLEETKKIPLSLACWLSAYFSLQQKVTAAEEVSESLQIRRVCNSACTHCCFTAGTVQFPTM